LDKFRFVQTENEIDDQASGFNAQANENDPGNNLQDYKYKVALF
jgi:hypothetical protein